MTRRARFVIPRRTRRASGWTLVSKGTGRDYYAAVSPDESVAYTFRTQQAALRYIRKQETAPLLSRVGL